MLTRATRNERVSRFASMASRMSWFATSSSVRCRRAAGTQAPRIGAGQGCCQIGSCDPVAMLSCVPVVTQVGGKGRPAEAAQHMTSQTVTLTLPDSLVERAKRLARRSRRPVDEVLVEALTTALPSDDTDMPALRASIGQLAYLNDAALWQAARATVPAEQRERLETLHQKQQRTSLTDDDRAEMEALERLYRDTVLVRAQAAVLLKQRHYDVSDLSQFEAVE